MYLHLVLRRLSATGCALALTMALLPHLAQATGAPADPGGREPFPRRAAMTSRRSCSRCRVARCWFGTVRARRRSMREGARVVDAERRPLRCSTAACVFLRSNVVLPCAPVMREFYEAPVRSAAVRGRRRCPARDVLAGAPARSCAARDGTILAPAADDPHEPSRFQRSTEAQCRLRLRLEPLQRRVDGRRLLRRRRPHWSVLWDETDIDIIDVTATTVSITPFPSFLPCCRTGLVERRRLADGKVTSTRKYVAPHADDVQVAVVSSFRAPPRTSRRTAASTASRTATLGCCNPCRSDALPAWLRSERPPSSSPTDGWSAGNGSTSTTRRRAVRSSRSARNGQRGTRGAAACGPSRAQCRCGARR